MINVLWVWLLKTVSNVTHIITYDSDSIVYLLAKKKKSSVKIKSILVQLLLNLKKYNPFYKATV